MIDFCLLFSLYYTGRVDSGKCNITVGRPSVCLFHGILTVTHLGAACDAASVHFDPTIRRTDILVLLSFQMCILHGISIAFTY